jgi:hypothetical protein
VMSRVLLPKREDNTDDDSGTPGDQASS